MNEVNSGPAMPTHAETATGTVTREYRMDMQLHRYRRAHIADPRFQYMTPLCEENSVYPERHLRDMVGIE